MINEFYTYRYLLRYKKLYAIILKRIAGLFLFKVFWDNFLKCIPVIGKIKNYHF